jgi:hypothetical protein
MDRDLLKLNTLVRVLTSSVVIALLLTNLRVMCHKLAEVKVHSMALRRALSSHFRTLQMTALTLAWAPRRLARMLARGLPILKVMVQV